MKVKKSIAGSNKFDRFSTVKDNHNNFFVHFHHDLLTSKVCKLCKLGFSGGVNKFQEDNVSLSAIPVVIFD